MISLVFTQCFISKREHTIMNRGWVAVMVAASTFSILYCGLALGADKYADFYALAANCEEGPTADYNVLYEFQRISNITVIGIHGGIEADTAAITLNLANRFGYNYYLFNAHPNRRSCARVASELHVTAVNFNDSRALDTVDSHTKAVAIHGMDRDRMGICVGGKSKSDVTAFMNAFSANRNRHPSAGSIHVIDATNSKSGACAGIGGTSPDNIVNKTRSHEGLQLEMGADVRRLIASDDNFNEAVFFPSVNAAMGN
jgi:phage replication-related protein YjqB (UPF0714/DUF867 family)